MEYTPRFSTDDAERNERIESEGTAAVNHAAAQFSALLGAESRRR